MIDANIFSSTDNTFAANTFITKFSHHDRKLLNSDLIELKKLRRILLNSIKLKTFKKNPLRRIGLKKL